MTKTQVFGVVLTPELAHRARVVAAIEGKSRSRLIRDLLENYLKGFDSSKIIQHHDESCKQESERGMNG